MYEAEASAIDRPLADAFENHFVVVEKAVHQGQAKMIDSACDELVVLPVRSVVSDDGRNACRGNGVEFAKFSPPCMENFGIPDAGRKLGLGA